MVLSIALYVVAVCALAVGLQLYRCAGIPSGRHRLQLALTAIVAVIALFIYAGMVRWAIAIPVTMLTVTALTLSYWWAWKWDSCMERRPEDIFSRRPELREKFGAHPFLKHLMKKPPR